MIIDINQNVTQLNRGYNFAEQDRLLDKLSYTNDAAFDSYHLRNESRCISNTRVDLLHQLKEWSIHSKECIFWLSGMAGTGKSTIARTIAALIADTGNLGASFFFSKGGGDLGRADKFIGTLAYQLTKQGSIWIIAAKDSMQYFQRLLHYRYCLVQSTLITKNICEVIHG